MENSQAFDKLSKRDIVRLLISSANILADKNPLLSISFIIRTCIRSGEVVLADESVADPVLRDSSKG